MYKFKRFLAFLVGLGSALPAFSIVTQSRPLSLGLIFSAIYFIFLSLDINRSQVVKRMFGSFFALPLVYILILWIMNLAFSSLESIYFPLTVFMNWLLMFYILLHSCSDRKASGYVLSGIAVGSLVLAILFYLNVGLEVVSTNEGDRIGLLGMNYNELCIIESIGFTIILNGVVLNNKIEHTIVRWLLIVPVVMQVVMVLTIASRTGAIIIVLVISISLFMVKGLKTSIKIITIIAVFPLIVFGTMNLLQGDSVIATRMNQTLYEGDTSGRTDIWLAYLKFFPEHPIFGVGNTGMLELSRKAGLGTIKIYGHESWYSPHNVLIEILMTTGIVGLIIMLRFWYKTFRNTIRGYRSNAVVTPLILMVPIIVVIISGQILESKVAWSIYAYMIASTVSNNNKGKVSLVSG